jgi:hypothetical protein
VTGIIGEDFRWFHFRICTQEGMPLLFPV